MFETQNRKHMLSPENSKYVSLSSNTYGQEYLLALTYCTSPKKLTLRKYKPENVTKSAVESIFIVLLSF